MSLQPFFITSWAALFLVSCGTGSGGPSPQTSSFDSSASRWKSISNNGAPSPRFNHSALWTGAKMLIYGGEDGSHFFGDGGLFDPSSDSWSPLANLNAPAARLHHSVVWTGSKMIVFGGYSAPYNGVSMNDGGLYDPATSSWSSFSSVGAPSPRLGHSAVWTGSKMIIFGGRSTNGTALADGAIYDLATDTWSPLPLSGSSPTGRYFHAAVWTGSKMIVYGGQKSQASSDVLGSGAAFDMAAGTWTAMPATNVATQPTAVWTGSEMLIYGGFNGVTSTGKGAKYNPSTNNWTPIPSFAARASHSGVWTGTKLIVFGGSTNLGDGGEFDLLANAWTIMQATGAPAARTGHSAVWTGDSMIVWGGAGNGVHNDGWLY